MTFLDESIPYIKARTLFEKKKDEVLKLAYEQGFELLNPSVREAYARARAALQRGLRHEQQGNLTMASRCYDEAIALLWAYLSEVHRMYAAAWILDGRDLLEQMPPSAKRHNMAAAHTAARERYRVGISVKTARPRDSLPHFEEAREMARSVVTQISETKPRLPEGAARFTIYLIVLVLAALFISALFMRAIADGKTTSAGPIRTEQVP